MNDPKAPLPISELETHSIEMFKSYIQNLVKFRSKGTVSAAGRACKSLSNMIAEFRIIRKQIIADKKQRIAERRSKKI
jgi:hypothetical protein